MTRSTLLLFLLLLFLAARAQSDSTRQLRLIFAGDIMGHDSQIQSAEVVADSLYDYSDCFEYVAPLLWRSHLAIGNLELTLPGKPPYKGYPRFRSPTELALTLRHAGFNLLVTANNHSNDAGPKGVIATLDALDDHHFMHTGTFRNSLERDAFYPLLVYSNNFKIALLNYTYGTNGIPTRNPARVNLLDTAQIAVDLREAERMDPDFTIVVLHWGKEYQTRESKVQKAIARKLIQHGADLVVGGHPHVVQPIRQELARGYEGDPREGLVVYSLGNFISGQTKTHTNGGILFEATLEKNEREGSTTLIDHQYIPVFRYRKKRPAGGYHYTVLPITSFLDESPGGLPLNESDRAAMKAYLLHVRGVMKGSQARERILTLAEMNFPSPKPDTHDRFRYRGR